MNETRGACQARRHFRPGSMRRATVIERGGTTAAPLPTDIERDIHRLAERVGGLDRLHELIGELRAKHDRRNR